MVYGGAIYNITAEESNNGEQNARRYETIHYSSYIVCDCTDMCSLFHYSIIIIDGGN